MTDAPLFVELGVKLSDGNFESRVNVPVTATEEQRKKFVQAWFALLQQALEICKPSEEKKADENTLHAASGE